MSVFSVNPMFPNATDEQKWDQFRIWRLSELQSTEWAVGNDSPLSEDMILKYKEYRSFLRNAPNKYKRVEDIVFPLIHEMIDYKDVLKPN